MPEAKPLSDVMVDYFRQEFEAVSIGVRKIRDELTRLRERLRSGTSPPEVLLEQMIELDRRAEFFEARAEQLEQQIDRLESYRPTLH